MEDSEFSDSILTGGNFHPDQMWDFWGFGVARSVSPDAGYPDAEHWSDVVPTLLDKRRAEFQREFQRCREEFLDTCHGACLLRQPELAQIVSESLLKFDADRNRMGDFVVIPNHVHLLVAFGSESGLKDQCASWLRYTARQINQATGLSGKFWQQEPFDHLVRSPEQYDSLRKYIADNPTKPTCGPASFSTEKKTDFHHIYFNRFMTTQKCRRTILELTTSPVRW